MGWIVPSAPFTLNTIFGPVTPSGLGASLSFNRVLAFIFVCSFFRPGAG